MEWMLMPYYRYAEFFGRSRRRELWMWTLFTILVGIVLGAIFGQPFYRTTVNGFSYQTIMSGPGSMLQSLFNLVNFIPGLAVGVRRLHDIGRSGWWMLLVFVPVLGWFTLLVFFVLDGNPGSNAYGLDPKDRGTVDVFR